jgi:hypothetical protein
MFSTDTKDDFETFYYKQVLDHFNYRPESYNTFNQRYFMNFKYWGGANSSAPILVYLGPEEPLDSIPESEGFMNDNAASFKALLVYIEVYLDYFSFNIQLSNSNIYLSLTFSNTLNN